MTYDVIAQATRSRRRRRLRTLALAGAVAALTVGAATYAMRPAHHAAASAVSTPAAAGHDDADAAA